MDSGKLIEKVRVREWACEMKRK